jgi:hypothetical protein
MFGRSWRRRHGKERAFVRLGVADQARDVVVLQQRIREDVRWSEAVFGQFR